MDIFDRNFDLLSEQDFDKKQHQRSQQESHPPSSFRNNVSKNSTRTFRKSTNFSDKKPHNYFYSNHKTPVHPVRTFRNRLIESTSTFTLKSPQSREQCNNRSKYWRQSTGPTPYQQKTDPPEVSRKLPELRPRAPSPSELPPVDRKIFGYQICDKRYIINKFNLFTCVIYGPKEFKSQKFLKNKSLNDLVFINAIKNFTIDNSQSSTIRSSDGSNEATQFLSLTSNFSTDDGKPSNEVLSKLDENNQHQKQRCRGIINLNRESINEMKKKSSKSLLPVPIKDDNQILGDGFEEFQMCLGKLRDLLAYNNTVSHIHPSIARLRLKVMFSGSNLLVTDLKGSVNNSVLPNVWEYCFHRFVDIYRNQCQDNIEGIDSDVTFAGVPQKKLFLSLAKEGVSFLNSLYDRLAKLYSPSNSSSALLFLKQLYRRYNELDAPLHSNLNKLTYIVKNIFIFLGDLWRYIERIEQQPTKKSKSYYMKAHMLLPKHPHTCHQLAMVSSYLRNYLDAVYFQILSLQYEIIQDRSIDCFQSKRFSIGSGGNLKLYYDNARKIYCKYLSIIQQEYDQHIKEKTLKQKRLKLGHSRINKYYRIEYWVRPDHTISKGDMYSFYDLAALNSNEKNPNLYQFYKEFMLNRFSHQDLKNRFLANFIVVHEMLNERIGLDRFYDVANKMVLEFELLMSNDTKPREVLKPLFLIQLFVINMYTIANKSCEDTSTLITTDYGFLYSNGLHVMSLMISILLKRMIKLFDSFRIKHEMFISTPVKGFSKGYKTLFSDKEPETIDELFGWVSNTIIDSGNAKNDPDKVLENQEDWIEFCNMLPCVKLWCDWCISFNPYFPPHETNDIKTSLKQNVWQVFAEFLTLLNHIKKYPIELCQNIIRTKENTEDLVNFSPKTLLARIESQNDHDTDWEFLQLPEYYILEGFKVSCDSPESSKYVKSPFITEIAYIYMRIDVIKKFGDYLCGKHHPQLEFDSEKHLFKSLIDVDDIENRPNLKLKHIQQEQLIEAMKRYREYCNLDSDNENGDDTQMLESRPQLKEDEFCSDDEEAVNEIEQLNLCPTERRKLLQYRMLRKQDIFHGKCFKIIEHVKEPKRRFVIKPKYVVFDTNCFVSHLNHMQVFVDKAPFIFTVPLIVVRELRHIINRESKRLDENNYLNPSDIQRAKNLLTRSIEALSFLKDIFNKKTNVKAVTNKGSILDTIDYEEEKDQNVVENDDLILFSCDKLVIRDGLNPMTDEDMKRLLEDAGEHGLTELDEYVFRDVVMVTDDLNLRLKALCYDVPVKKFKQFRLWAKTLIPTEKKVTN